MAPCKGPAQQHRKCFLEKFFGKWGIGDGGGKFHFAVNTRKKTLGFFILKICCMVFCEMTQCESLCALYLLALNELQSQLGKNETASILAFHLEYRIRGVLNGVKQLQATWHQWHSQHIYVQGDGWLSAVDNRHGYRGWILPHCGARRCEHCKTLESAWMYFLQKLFLNLHN